MDDMNAFDRQLASVVLQRVGPSRPVNDAAIFTAITATHSPKWRFQSMFSATRFVLAGAIVALFGGFLLAGVVTQPSEEPVPAVGASASPEHSRTEAPIELPIEIPADVTSGRMETPIGPARWVHLSGTADMLPDILEPVAVPGGFVSLDEGQWVPCPSGDPCWEPATLWFSSDLLTWTPRMLPFDRGRASLAASRGGYWITVNAEPKSDDESFEPTLWRSTDALDWEQVDLSGVEPPAPSGIEWRAYLGGVTGEGDTVLVTASYVAMDKAGTDEASLEGWALVLIEDGRVDQVELPDAMTEGRGFAITGTVGGFRAWRGDSDSLQVWSSSDGVEWTLDESLGDDADGPTSDWINGPVELVPWGHGGVYERDTYWESGDGIEWQAYDPPPGDGLARLGPGWVALIDSGLAYYPDDSEDMLLIADSPQIDVDGSLVLMGRISDNTIRHSVSDGPGGRRDHWIVTFEGLPTRGS